MIFIHFEHFIFYLGLNMIKQNNDLYMRDAYLNELDQVYLMGEDVWSEGASTSEYLMGCRASSKYKQGQFKILTDGQRLLSSLIVYDLSDDRLGIGSIATPVQQRKKGYASQLILLVMEQAILEGKLDIFLFSDIGAAFYEKLGFSILPDHHQKYDDSICMLRTERAWDEWLALGLEVPKYF